MCEHLCVYEYKPTECVGMRKFVEADDTELCPKCEGNGFSPYPISCGPCHGSGCVRASQYRAGVTSK